MTGKTIMTPVAYNEATTTAVTQMGNFMLGTLMNFAPMLLGLFAVIFIFKFLARKFSGR